NRLDGLGLDIKGVTHEALAILQEDDWPGNVRELEAVVKRAMVRRRVKWVTAEDIKLPRLRRDRIAPPSGGILTSLQDLALRLASSRGRGGPGRLGSAVRSFPRVGSEGVARIGEGRCRPAGGKRTGSALCADVVSIVRIKVIDAPQACALAA